jgi:hypothetical protein
MRTMVRRLSAGIIILMAAVASAQAQVGVEDNTPCDNVAPGAVTVPDDFTLVYRGGPVQASFGITTITKLNASGQASIETIRNRGMKKEQTVNQWQVSKQAVQRLYANVLACRFFDLDKSYWNRRVMDGSVSSMDVTAGGKTHRVIVHHYPVTRFSSIVGALNTALEIR